MQTLPGVCVGDEAAGDAGPGEAQGHGHRQGLLGHRQVRLGHQAHHPRRRQEDGIENIPPLNFQNVKCCVWEVNSPMNFAHRNLQSSPSLQLMLPSHIPSVLSLFLNLNLSPATSNALVSAPQENKNVYILYSSEFGLLNSYNIIKEPLVACL